jgi:hypothetical protein
MTHRYFVDGRNGGKCYDAWKPPSGKNSYNLSNLAGRQEVTCAISNAFHLYSAGLLSSGVNVMAGQCFKKKDSKPPECAVHGVRLAQKRLPKELIASGYKGFTFLVCPASGEVTNDEASTK